MENEKCALICSIFRLLDILNPEVDIKKEWDSLKTKEYEELSKINAKLLSNFVLDKDGNIMKMC